MYNEQITVANMVPVWLSTHTAHTSC